jgi:hypothetical protein
MMVVKISVGIFFARIVIEPWHLKFIYTNVGVCIVSSIATFFFVIFRCGGNVSEYALRQLKNQCTTRRVDNFMAYQSGKDELMSSRVGLLANGAFDSDICDIDRRGICSVSSHFAMEREHEQTIEVVGGTGSLPGRTVCQHALCGERQELT